MYCVLCSTVSMPRTSERARMLQRLHALQLRTEQRHKRLKMNARRHQVATTNDEDDEDIENDSESASKEPDPPRPPINYHTALLDDRGGSGGSGGGGGIDEAECFCFVG